MNRKGMIPPAATIFLVLAIIVAVFIVVKITGNAVNENDKLVYGISKLPELNLEDIKTYEQYKEFADKSNDLISIINKQTGASIPEFETTTEAWSKASKFISKYAPLINNYNLLIDSSRNFEEDKSDLNYRDFYEKMGVFSLEFTFISASIFHQVTFDIVGGVFRSIGIGSLALKCPACASAIMSSAYWSIKTALVESASKGADEIFKKINDTMLN